MNNIDWKEMKKRAFVIDKHRALHAMSDQPVITSKSNGGSMALFLIGHEPYRYMSFAKKFENRIFTTDTFPTDDINHLISLLNDSSVGTIVMSSHYPRNMFRRGIDLLGLLSSIGLKCFLIDNDPFENKPSHPLYRAILNDVVCRFSTWEILNRDWDAKFNISNVIYTPILQEYNSYYSDYSKKIIVCSNLRLEYHKPFIYEATDLIKYIGKHKFICNAANWYVEKRYDIIENLKINDVCDEVSKLWRIFSAAMDIYKIEIVGWIKDRHGLELYGDNWGSVFPDCYKGYLNENELLEKLSEPNVFILPNLSFTYMSGYGPLYDAVRFGKKFLHPRVISGNIPCFEFSDADELNEKINHFPDQTEEMIKMKSYYQAFVDEAARKINDAKP